MLTLNVGVNTVRLEVGAQRPGFTLVGGGADVDEVVPHPQSVARAPRLALAAAGGRISDRGFAARPRREVLAVKGAQGGVLPFELALFARELSDLALSDGRSRAHLLALAAVFPQHPVCGAREDEKGNDRAQQKADPHPWHRRRRLPL